MLSVVYWTGGSTDWEANLENYTNGDITSLRRARPQ